MNAFVTETPAAHHHERRIDGTVVATARARWSHAGDFQANNVVPYRYADCTVQHSTYAGQMCQEPGLVIPQFTVGGPGPSLIIADPTAVQIYKHPSATETGVYKKPIPFGGMGKPVDQEGFSDHVPTP